MNLFHELKRRNVIRVGTAYIVLAWLVIQVVETIFPAFGFGQGAVRVTTIAFAVGLVPVLIFAWVFELTPEGLKKESEVVRDSSITTQTGKRLDRFIMLFLALALGYFGFDKFVLSESREASIAEAAREEGRSQALVESYGNRSLAVLPFVNMSDDKANEYFSDGISEELMNLLAKIPELRVISRSSAFALKGKQMEAPELARELNVSHLLEGSVRKSGEQVRITAQLIDANADVHIWSETYDRTLDNIFAVQDEIAGQVVDELKVRLLGEVPHTTETDAQAYALYLRGKFQRRQTSAESLAQAESLLKQALEIDPEYLPAIDELITVYINQAHTGERPFRESYEEARTLALGGLAMDPDSGRMYGQLAWILTFFDGDLQGAANMFERALELVPSDTSLKGDAATFLGTLGRVEESLALTRFVIERDPLHPVAQANYAAMLANAGEYEQSILEFREAQRLSPDYGVLHYMTGIPFLLKGEARAALDEFEMESYEPYRLTGEAMAHHALGQAEASDTALAALIKDHGEEAEYHVAQVYAFRNQRDKAFEWLNKAAVAGSFDLAEVVVNPLFGSLTEDERWLPYLRRLGKSPEQLAAIEFEVELPQAGAHEAQSSRTR